MDDAVIVQVADGAGQFPEPLLGQFERQALRMPVEHHVKGFAGDILHHDPLIALGVAAEIEERNEVRMLEVQALRDAAKLNVAVAADELERDFLAAVERPRNRLRRTRLCRRRA